jgi:hypothetical protein
MGSKSNENTTTATTVTAFLLSIVAFDIFSQTTT